MADRKVGSILGNCTRNEFLINKGLASTRQQQVNEQTRPRPISNYNDGKNPEHERQQPRKNVDFLLQRLQPTEVKRGNLNPSTQVPLRRVQDFFQQLPAGTNWRNPKYVNSETSDEELESLYNNSEKFLDNQSETMGESEFDPDEEAQKSIDQLQQSLHRISETYLRKMNCKVEETINKLKSHERARKVIVHGNLEVGDGKPLIKPETQDLYKKMEAAKKECYKTIEANLIRLKSIDNVIEELLRNDMKMPK